MLIHLEVLFIIHHTLNRNIIQFVLVIFLITAMSIKMFSVDHILLFTIIIYILLSIKYIVLLLLGTACTTVLPIYN